MTYPASIEKALAYLKAADIPKYLKNEKCGLCIEFSGNWTLPFLLLYWQVFLLILFILALLVR